MLPKCNVQFEASDKRAGAAGSGRHPRLRRGLEAIVGLGLAWLLAQTGLGLLLGAWQIEGWLFGLVVPSGSMAPALLGPHYDVACRQCGFHFTCDAEATPLSGRAACPNCGFPDNRLAGATLFGGDRVLLDRGAWRCGPPGRWEVAAFTHPQQPGMLCVKRIVGLPGEEIQIRDGDVWANGRIVRKSLEQLRAMAIVVHDADCQPRGLAAVPRWQPQGPAGRWRVDRGRFLHAAAAGPTDESVAWCIYHHLHGWPGDPTAAVSQHGPAQRPVDDDDPYNAGRPRCVDEIRPVRDLLLRLRIVRAEGAGQLLVRLTVAGRPFVLRLEPRQRRCAALCDARVLNGTAGPLPWSPGSHRLEVAYCDRRFLAALDDRVLVSWDDDSRPRPDTGHAAAGQLAAGEPVAVGAAGLDVELSEVRLARDVYYVSPPGVLGRWGTARPVCLGPDEYFVLGDNSVLSDDSRTWAGGAGVPAALLYGHPLLIYFPLRQTRVWGRTIQLPDPTRIGYIR